MIIPTPSIKKKTRERFWLGVCLRKLLGILVTALPLLAWWIIPWIISQRLSQSTDINSRHSLDVLGPLRDKLSHSTTYALQAHIKDKLENLRAWMAAKGLEGKSAINIQKEVTVIDQLGEESTPRWWKSPAPYLLLIFLTVEVYGFIKVYFWNRHAKMTTATWDSLQKKLDEDEDIDTAEGECRIIIQKDFLENYRPNMVAVYEILDIMHYRVVYDWGWRKRYFEMDQMKIDGKTWAFPAYYSQTTEEDLIFVDEYFISSISPRQVWEDMTCHNEPRCVRPYHMMFHNCQTMVQEILLGQGIIIFTWREWLPFTVLAIISRSRKIYKKIRKLPENKEHSVYVAGGIRKPSQSQECGEDAVLSKDDLRKEIPLFGDKVDKGSS